MDINMTKSTLNEPERQKMHEEKLEQEQQPLFFSDADKENAFLSNMFLCKFENGRERVTYNCVPSERD
jgi:hypothetical protein